MSAHLKRLEPLRSLAVGSLLGMAIVYWLVLALNGFSITSDDLFGVMQIAAAYGLLALALGLTMIAAEFDLSTLGSFALGGMIAVKTGTDSMWLGVLIGGAVGAIAGLIQGTIVARFEINSMSLTLGGYLVLLGLAVAIGHNSSVPVTNIEASLNLSKPIATFFSIHSLVVLAGFAIVGATMAWTRVGREIRAVGDNRRGARVAGVRTIPVLVGVFVAAGALAAIAGGLNAYNLGSASSTVGFAPLVFAAAASLLGGVGLAGGRGSAAGILAGTLVLSLLQSMFGVLATENWVTEVVTGALLAAAAAIAAPQLRARWLGLRRALRGSRGPGGVTAQGSEGSS